MATRRFDCTKDARVGTDGSLDLGAGACNHLPWGNGGGYDYQTLLQFDHDWSSMTDVTEVRLYVRNTDEYHLTRGSSSGTRQFRFQPVTEAWSAGTASHPMTTANAVVWGDISLADGDIAIAYETGPFTTDDVNNSWNDFDVTESFRYFAPTTATFPGGAGLGNTNRGFRIVPDDSATDKGEFWSEDKGASYAAYVVVTYTSHGTVSCAITDPVQDEFDSGGPTYGTPENDWTGTASCADGHAISTIQVQVDNNSDFSSTIIDTNTGFTIGGGTWSKNISSASLPRGTLLYTRAKATCASGGVSAWSTTVSFYFTDADVPVITGTADQVMELSISGTETNPCTTVRWSFTDPQGMAQVTYRARLYADDGTTLLEDSGEVTSDATYHRFSYSSLSRGTYYKFDVMVENEDGVSAGYTSKARRKAQWGLYNQYLSLGGTPTSWSWSSSQTLPTDTRIDIQHSSSASSTAGTWDTSLDSVSFNTYYHVRYWLFAWHGATTPTLTAFTLRYSTGSGTSADNWTLAAGASLSTSKYVLGSRAVKMVGNGTTRVTYSAAFSVRPSTDYVLSARGFSVGNSGGYVRLRNEARTVTLLSTNILTASTSTETFEDLASSSYYTTGASETQVVVECVVTGAAPNECYFDTIQLEPGRVVSAYRPGGLGRSTVVDMGGIQVDGNAGGTLRLRGSNGSADAVTELGTMGLEVGALTLREVSAPSSPSTGEVYLYAKSDGKAYIKDDAGTETDLTGAGSFGSPVATQTANADGGDSTYARSDHEHKHAFFGSAYQFGTGDVTSAGTLNTTKDYAVSGGTVTALVMPHGGKVMGIGVRLGNARTGGTITFQVYNQTTTTLIGPTATINGTDTQTAYAAAASHAAATTFSAGDRLGVRSTVTAATFAPITADASIVFTVIYDTP